jgi:subtilisin family serine protease
VPAAPSQYILSTAPDGGHDFFTGSSIASAHVTGMAALAREANPKASPGDIANALLASAAKGRPGSRRQVSLPNACRAGRAGCLHV